MALIRYEHHHCLLESVTEILSSFRLDLDGKGKFQTFLERAKYKLKLVEHSLGLLAGKGIINEDDFAPPLSDARRMLEECFVGGWAEFNRQGTGCFGNAVNLEVTLRSMTHSLGGHMVWQVPEEKC